MEIDKSKILDMLKSRGDDDKADKADKELPDTVDTEQDKGTLDKLGIDPKDLISGFSL